MSILSEKNPYVKSGFNNREDYLKDLAFEYGVDYGVVKIFAEVLGPNEDFDGLINTLEDAEGFDLY